MPCAVSAGDPIPTDVAERLGSVGRGGDAGVSKKQ